MADWKGWTLAAVRETAVNLIFSYWPLWGAPIVTAVLGYVGGYPLFTIFLGLLGATAAVALVLNQTSQWLAARSPADKVSIGPLFVGIKNSQEEPVQTLGLKLGVNTISRALFPIEVRIDELEVRIANRIPSEKFYKRSLTIEPGHLAQFTAGLIDLSDIDRRGRSLNAEIKAKDKLRATRTPEI